MSQLRVGRRVRNIGSPDLQPATATTVAALLVLVFAVGDLLTGPYLAFSTFYLLAVVVAAWLGGRSSGLVISAMAAVSGVITTAIRPEEVPPVITVLNGFMRFAIYASMALVVSAEHRSQRQIAALSFSDSLTGLANRREFFRRGEVALHMARRHDRPLAVVYFDVDDLKVRNDTHGHRAGDAMLVDFATAATRTFRETDVLARLGGDEFCFLLPETDFGEALEVIDRFEAALAETEADPIRASIGVVAGRPDGTSDLDAILGEADSLMYEAKLAGKGRRRARASLRPKPGVDEAAATTDEVGNDAARS